MIRECGINCPAQWCEGIIGVLANVSYTQSKQIRQKNMNRPYVQRWVYSNVALEALICCYYAGGVHTSPYLHTSVIMHCCRSCCIFSLLAAHRYIQCFMARKTRDANKLVRNLFYMTMCVQCLPPLGGCSNIVACILNKNQANVVATNKLKMAIKGAKSNINSSFISDQTQLNAFCDFIVCTKTCTWHWPSVSDPSCMAADYKLSLEFSCALAGPIKNNCGLIYTWSVA